MFSEEIQYQLDFAKNSAIKPLYVTGREDVFYTRFNNLKRFLESTKYKKISLVSYHECFSELNYLDEILDLVNQHNDKEIYISATTSTRLNNFYHPLINIFFWRGTEIRNHISWKSDDNKVILFDESRYKNIIKNNKGILSTRKETNLRNYLFSIIDESRFEGILRYGKWTIYPDLENEDTFKKELKFPKFYDLLNEYKSSYVSFVTETELSDFMNPITEKTFISMLTKTMPIILGGRGFVREVKDMGLYVFNDEFGFTEDDDNLKSFDVNKADAFNRCIENYNKMSKSDIADMYNSNIDKIENNYKIVSELLFDTKKTIL